MFLMNVHSILSDKMKLMILVLFAVLLPCQQSVSVGNDTLWPGGSGSGFSEDGSFDELSLTCAERNIITSGETLGNYSVTANNVVRSFRVVYFTVLFVASVSLNSLLFFLVIKYKKLHTLSFAIALQVVVIDITLAVFYCLPTIISTAAGEWILGKEVCVLTGFLTFTPISMRTCLMFVFVIDRFMSVFFPYFYPRHKVKIAVSLSVPIWLLCTVLCTLMFPGILDCFTFVSSFNVCIASGTCSGSCSIFIIILFNSIGWPSAVVPTVLFTALYCKGRRLSKSTATLAPSAAISGEDKAVAKRERRATITFFLLFVSIFAVTVPTSTTTVVIGQVSNLIDLPNFFFIVQAIAGSAGSLYIVTDPIVLMRDRDVREVLSSIKVCRLLRKCCSKKSSTAEN